MTLIASQFENPTHSGTVVERLFRFDICSQKHSICGGSPTPASTPKASPSLRINTHTHTRRSAPSSHLLTRELQSEALLAGEEVCGELQGDGVEGAVRVLGQRRAAQLPQEHAPVVGAVPYPQHVVDLLGVENQEMQTVEEKIN